RARDGLGIEALPADARRVVGCQQAGVEIDAATRLRLPEYFALRMLNHGVQSRIQLAQTWIAREHVDMQLADDELNRAKKGVELHAQAFIRRCKLAGGEGLCEKPADAGQIQRK